VRARFRWEADTEQVLFENLSDLEPGFVSAFERGLRGAASGRTGIPFTGLAVTLLGARTHPVDSNERSFIAVAQQALREASERIGVVLLEPWMRFRLATSRVKPTGLLAVLAPCRVQPIALDGREMRGRVPLAELQRFRAALHGRTAGGAVVTLELDSFESVPEPIARRVREARASDMDAVLR
jgi:elongation factor G